jgi:hypothetical protein
MREPKEILRRLAAAAVVAALLLAPREAPAFCGFYVSGADAKLFNNATQVVLLRDGTRTVLSMQNNYQGPPEDFAMVVPVPIVLQKENVKTLPAALFDRVDRLAAPRLVEYWEQDPCPPEVDYSEGAKGGAIPAPEMVMMSAAPGGHGVKIEAAFTVGEYDIVILSAEDAVGLDAWLRENKYKIPAGAEPILRPYVQSGMKFFVAKVDVKKVRFEKGMATLSPLRFHYDTESFNLPVRLGLMNSAGTQDLIVHVLARGQRYEVANYPNVTIPTNIDVSEAARDQFGAFYAALFDKTLQTKRGAVVTEYSWDASSCDPCPTPALEPGELATLGGDVIPGEGEEWQRYQGFVVTRLHARYDKASLGEDLVFRAAPPIEGGREVRDQSGKLENGSKAGGINNFQGRYAIRHAWNGPVTCDNPVRGVWGGPPEGLRVAGDVGPKPALNVAFAPRGASLPSFLAQDVPELSVKAAGSPPAGWSAPRSGGCGACVIGLGSTGERAALSAAAAAVAAGVALAVRRRRRQLKGEAAKK